MRSQRRWLSVAATIAMGSLTLASNLSAQEVALPMGRTIGAACTHSVTVPAQGGPALSFPPLPQSTGAPPEPTRLVKVRDDVYAVINANNAVVPDIPLYGGNVAIYLTDDGAVLVDSKTERMHDDLVAKVRSLTDAPLKYVVLTHHHADHSGGAARLQALGARVIMSAADAQRMGAPGQPGVPQMSYEGHAVIALGGKRIDLLEFCGHTSGDTVVYLSDARVVVSGDLVATPASIPPIVNYADGGNWTDLVRTLDVLAALDFDFMIAGHGPVLTKQQFLEYRDKITAIRVRAQELVRAEQSADEIAQALGAEFAWGSGPAADNIPGMMLELR